MKKFLSLLLCFLFTLTIVSCNDNQEPNNPNGDGPNQPVLPPADTSVGFVIHFDLPTKRDDGSYKYNLWLWETGKDGADFQFNGEDDYGVYAQYTWEETSTTLEANGLGFIVKENKVWDESPAKDVESDRFIDFASLELDSNGYYHVWLKTGDSKIYTDANGGVTDIVQYFSILYEERKNDIRLWFQTNKEFESYKITLGDEVIVSSDTPQSDKFLTNTSKKIVYSIGSEIPSITSDFELTVTFKESGKTITKIASKDALYDTKVFNDQYYYDGQLGAIYSSEATTFRVWSPVSTEIKLRVYETGTPESLGGNNTYQEYTMTAGEKGTWEYTINGDLAGKYYTYVVTNYLYKGVEIVDPYAKSAGINGLRGMIVDFSKTNPEGWDTVVLHDYEPTELTVYETHISDLTSSSTWGGTPENAKLFKGFYESGTKYRGVTTGFDHIKELGVNAVQILPFFDSSNNEDPTRRSFNWGYNPLNYNVVDGSYASDPYDGYVRIQEFKTLVMEYNKAGINIIMDVVYNHVNGLERCNFDVLMPRYYFRYTSTGASNGSGCGNETASERAMFRKFMIDSTEFWAKEYKLGGFRFDLMAIHDVETMNQLTKNLHENVNEAITVYGEPWAGGTIAMPDGYTSAAQSAMNRYEGYGCFNDKMRDALIKGGLSGVSEKGWITNSSSASSGDVSTIKAGISGLIIVGNTKHEVEKCINYVTCHDNYTLYDRIKAAGITDEATVKKMAMLANSVVFTSQGVTFMLAGEEFLRTKGGNENSYNASYQVNELNYALKLVNKQMFENYKKLIALKKAGTIFNLNDEESKAMTFTVNDNNSMISYKIVDTENNREYYIIHSNGVSGTKTVNLEGYTIYLDTLNSNITANANVTVAEYQTIIAYKDLQ